jgi:sporulation protein YlmC with PRC-barrel domain
MKPARRFGAAQRAVVTTRMPAAKERTRHRHVSKMNPDATTAIRLRCRRHMFITPERELQREKRMLKYLITAATVGLLSVSAYAAADNTYPNATMETAIPQSAVTVTDWYKQDVYDPNNNKIGEVMDVLVDKSGKVSTLIVGVGGFLGVDQKDVAVPFEHVHATTKNNKMRLVMNTTKDSLKSAPGFKYDSSTTTWVPAGK